jgi:hypothetical protein
VAFEERISLAGVEEINRRLAAMATAAENAFKRIETAAAGARLSNITPQVNQVGASFKSLLGSAAALRSSIAGLAAGFGAFALGRIVADAASAADAIQDLADVAGTSTDEVQGLIGLMAQFGVGTEAAMNTISRLAVRIETDWPKIRQEIEDSADAQAKLKLGAEQAAQAVVAADNAIITSKRALKKTQEEIAQLGERHARQSIISSNSVRSAELALRDARLRLREARGENVSFEREELELAQAALQVKEAEQRLDDARAQKEREAAEQERELIEARNRATVQRAQLESAELQKQAAILQKQEALKKIEDERRNNIENIVDALKRASAAAAAGKPLETPFAGVNATPENLAKGIIAMAAGLKDFNGDLTKLSEAGPKVNDVLEEMAEAFQALSPQQQVAVGRALAGRGFNKDLVDFLAKSRELREQLRREGKALADVFKENKLGLSPQQIKDLDNYDKKLNELGFTFDKVRQKIGVGLAGLTLPGLENLTKFLQQLGPGLDDLLKGDFSKSGFNQLFPNLVANTRTVWSQALAEVRIGLDNIRNLDFSTSAAGQIWASLVSGADTAWTAIKASADAAWAAISAGAQNVFSSLPSVIQSALGGIAEILIAPFRVWFDAVSGFIRAIAALFAGLSASAPSTSGLGTGTATNPGGFAAGGRVWGPGSSTSDSILARLSRGEFVIRAAAVEHFGPAFFAALNNLRMPKFSLGGLADGLAASLAIPRFAGGGMVPAGTGGSLHPVTINFPGAGGIGVRASGDAVAQMRRAAVRAQFASGGRKPSGYA